MKPLSRSTGLRWGAYLLLFLWVLPGGLSAQVTTGTIYGTIMDQTGSVVPGVEVSATNEETGVVRQVVSNDLGQFTISSLPPGPYTISAQLPGFKTYRRTGTVVAAGQRASVSVILEVGEVQDEVTVSGSKVLLAISPEDNETRTTQEIEELPVARRDWTSLLEISTGANFVTSSSRGSVSYNGLPASASSFTMDGITATGDPSSNSLSFYQNYNDIKGVNQESIRSLEVSKGVYSAEVSSMTGNLNVITKSGTNRWHGSLFESYQTGGWNARNPFSSVGESLVRHQFGGSVGGPIVPNKAFVFGSIERPHLTALQTVTATVPTPFTRETMIAANPGAQPVLDFFPLPTESYDPDDLVGLFVGQQNAGRRDLFALVRYDQYLDDANQFNIVYSRARPDAAEPRRAVSTRVRDGLQERVLGSFSHSAPTWNTESRFGFNRSDTDRFDTYFPETNGYPAMRCDCGFRIDGEVLSRGGSTTSLEQVFFWASGRHNLKFGGKWVRTLARFADVEAPEYRFRTLDDFAEQDFRSVRFTWGQAESELAQTQWGFFLQDDFRWTSKLTLNLGFRYDIWTVPEERDNRLFNRGAPFGFGSFRPPDSVFDADWNNIQPRIGLAYAVNNRTVIRSGFGVFHSVHPPRGSAQSVTFDGPTLPSRVDLSGNQAVDFGAFYPTDNDQAEALGIRTGIIGGSALDEHNPNPYSLQWTLGIQQQLSENTVFDIAYVGNHGLHGTIFLAQNRVDRLTGERPNPDYAEFSFHSPSESTTYNALQVSLRRKFAQTFAFDVNYTYSRTISFSSDADVLSPTPIQETDMLFLERGPSEIDIPQRFIASVLYELQFAADSAFVRHVFSGWQMTGIIRAQSGSPFDITQGGDIENQRPDFVGSSREAAVINQGLQWLDPGAFQEVPESDGGAPIRPGTLARNAFRGPGFWNVDATIAKNISLARFYEGMRLQVRLEVFNLFNKRTFSGVVSEIDNDLFGQFTSARSPRSLQLSARFSF